MMLTCFEDVDFAAILNLLNLTATLSLLNLAATLNLLRELAAKNCHGSICYY